MKQVFKFSEDDFRSLRKLKLLMGFVMIGIGIAFMCLVNPIGRSFPVSERSIYKTLLLVLLTASQLINVVVPLSNPQSRASCKFCVSDPFRKEYFFIFF